MVASALLTVALFGFAIWNVVVGTPGEAPVADVTDVRVAADGEVVYTVEVRNSADVGLVAATVQVGCTQPPATLEFENVPAVGTRTGVVVCPPGTEDPAVSVASWIPA